MIKARADVVGSLLRPSKLIEALHLRSKDKISPQEFKRIEDAAVDAALQLQEEAGLEVGFIDAGGVAEAVQVSGSYAILADGEEGLKIFDVSDPANPQLIGFYDTLASGYAKDISLSGEFVYVADGTSSLLQVIDITDPADPQLSGEYETHGYAWAVYITDSYAYVANGENGMLILHLSIE